MRLVRFESADLRSSPPVWVNPDRVVAVHAGSRPNVTMIVSEGRDLAVKGEPAEVVDRLRPVLPVDADDAHDREGDAA